MGFYSLLDLALACISAQLRSASISKQGWGSMRLAKVHFEDGRFLQVHIGMKGNHTGVLVDNLVAALMPKTN